MELHQRIWLLVLVVVVEAWPVAAFHMEVLAELHLVET
jgi:hypothetical protein